MFEIVRSYMNGLFSVIPGKDVTTENFGYYQTKPTSSKLFLTQTSIQRVSLLFVSINLPFYRWHYGLCSQSVDSNK